MVYVQAIFGVLCCFASFFAWGNCVEVGAHLENVSDSTKQPLAITGLGWKALCFALAYLAFRNFGGTL